MMKKILFVLLMLCSFTLFAEENLNAAGENEIVETEKSGPTVGGSVGIKFLYYYPIFTGAVDIDKFEINLSMFPNFAGVFLSGISLGYNTNPHSTGWSHSIGAGCYLFSGINTVIVDPSGSSEGTVEDAEYNPETRKELSVESLWGAYYRLGYRFSSNLMLSGQFHLPMFYGSSNSGKFYALLGEEPGAILYMMSLLSFQLGLRYCFN